MSNDLCRPEIQFLLRTSRTYLCLSSIVCPLYVVSVSLCVVGHGFTSSSVPQFVRLLYNTKETTCLSYSCFYLNALCSYAKVSAQMSVFIYVAANEEALLTRYLESRQRSFTDREPFV